MKTPAIKQVKRDFIQAGEKWSSPPDYWRESKPDGRGVSQSARSLQGWPLYETQFRSILQGQTQALPLGALGDVCKSLTAECRSQKRFMHHYNFHYSALGKQDRCWAGLSWNRTFLEHWVSVLAGQYSVWKKTFHTVRLVSRSAWSNSSTSQASICKHTCNDAEGERRIKSASCFEGVLRWVLSKSGEQYTVLTDIQGMEGNAPEIWTLQVAGTEKANNSPLQMDIKIEGTFREILEKRFNRRKSGNDPQQHACNIKRIKKKSFLDMRLRS